MELFKIFGKVVAKNRAFGNNIIFLQQFFPFPYVPPGGAYGRTAKFQYIFMKLHIIFKLLLEIMILNPLDFISDFISPLMF